MCPHRRAGALTGGGVDVVVEAGVLLLEGAHLAVKEAGRAVDAPAAARQVELWHNGHRHARDDAAHAEREARRAHLLGVRALRQLVHGAVGVDDAHRDDAAAGAAEAGVGAVEAHRHGAADREALDAAGRHQQREARGVKLLEQLRERGAGERLDVAERGRRAGRAGGGRGRRDEARDAREAMERERRAGAGAGCPVVGGGRGIGRRGGVGRGHVDAGPGVGKPDDLEGAAGAGRGRLGSEERGQLGLAAGQRDGGRRPLDGAGPVAAAPAGAALARGAQAARRVRRARQLGRRRRVERGARRRRVERDRVVRGPGGRRQRCRCF
jgi:hypothetical protein